MTTQEANPLMISSQIRHKILTYDNMFDSIDCNLQFENIFYSVKGTSDILLNCLGIIDDKLIAHSNDFTSLFKNLFYQNPDPRAIVWYDGIVDTYNYMASNINLYIQIEEPVVIFIGSYWCIGATHAFSTMWCFINEYLINGYDKKILVYKNSTKGILDILIRIFGECNIIYIDDSVIYKLCDATFFVNKYHSIITPVETDKLIHKFIDKYLYDPNLNLNPDVKTICIIKSSISNNSTFDDVADIDDVVKYCEINNYMFVDSVNYSEIEMINIIHRAKHIKFSWGSAFFKNVSYVSDVCESIEVFVYSVIFTNQYYERVTNNDLTTKYKNAVVTYKVLNNFNEIFSL
ncbi:MAG: hypothetical protein Gaeavirus20_7 [Gaeavirus sp.]|uniref:Uncharacterized protein n=1 Tax=Gaeavirus sp. TaxID=2487767 RepID=A0A3G4ZZC3_9VIRU|nr:MAG: hypothetical protein Gaeavirus20_7 [Gaeavirus sp.]